MDRSTRARRRASLLVASVVAALTLAAAPVAAQSPAPSLADPADQLALISRFYELLALDPGSQKSDGLRAFLGPEFQIQRTNGDHFGRDEYAAEPAQVHTWAIESFDLTTSADGSVAVVTYLVTTDSTIDETTQTTTAPRLAVFHWDGSDWTMSALGNFTALPASSAASAPAPSPAPSPAG